MEDLPIRDGIFIGDENDRLEFKSSYKKKFGSIWETYSSFANTFGGRIILGITDADHEVIGIDDAEMTVKNLWDAVNDRNVVNRNILYNGNIWTYDSDGKTLIVIDVPRADRYLRPIYYKSLESGTFKRIGEGDYRCSMPEIAAMMRDQSSSSYDSTLLDGTSLDDIDMESLRAYRREMDVYNPSHIWNECDDEEFASVIGVVGHSTSRLTVAGLLMFGKEHVISYYFPNFKLDYFECSDTGEPLSYRLVTGGGRWNGNVFNFYLSVRDRISDDLCRSPDLDQHDRADIRRALRECLVNALTNADYPGNLVIRIARYPNEIRFSNSGLFLMPRETAERGGESDPRNAFIARMFSMIGQMERAGAGIGFISTVWKRFFGKVPVISEDTDNQRVTVLLPIGRHGMFTTGELIIDLISKDPKISAVKMSSEIGVSVPTIKNHLKRLTDEGVVKRVGGTRGHWDLT